MRSILNYISNRGGMLRHPALCGFVLIIISFSAYQYFQVKVYDFPKSKPYSGKSLYNPYAEQSGKWLKANFHAHSKSWMGITNGKQTGEEVVQTYQDYGYDVASLSDYHRINQSIYTAGNIGIPVYEHGMNINKQHHLGIGATDVTFEDVLLWQNIHVKQFLLERMAYNSPVVCLNHPGLRGSHTEQEIEKLTGYHCMEVLNNERVYTSHWDAAHSSGRPVWILANDDNHDVTKENIVVSWTLVHASQQNQDGVLNALKNGQTLGLRRKVKLQNLDSLRAWAAKNKGDILKAVTTLDTTVTFMFNQKVATLTLIGQHGKIMATYKNTDSVTYKFSDKDTYIRAEADAGDFLVYLNPIVRYDGISIPQNTKLATVNFTKTLALRISIVLLYLLMVRILFPSFLRWLLYGQNSKTYPTYEQAIS